MSQLETLRRHRRPSSELNGTKRSIERNILFSLEYNGGVGGIADRINSYNHFLKNPDSLEKDVQRYRKATPESIREFAAKYLTKSRASLFTACRAAGSWRSGAHACQAASNEGGESVNADEAWRAIRPPPERNAHWCFRLPSRFSWPMA